MMFCAIMAVYKAGLSRQSDIVRISAYDYPETCPNSQGAVYAHADAVIQQSMGRILLSNPQSHSSPGVFFNPVTH